MATAPRALQAFKRLPADVCQRLASGATFASVAPGSVLVEEDAPGDCMFVVMSGSCQVRARGAADVPLQVAGPRALGHGGSRRGGWPLGPDAGELLRSPY
jgi:hypothetical protein